MNTLARSTITAVIIAAAIQFLMVGLLSHKLPREVCRPGVSFEKTLKFNDINTLQLSHSDGAIEVQTHTLSTVNIQADIRVYFSMQETQLLALKHLESMIEAKTIDSGILSVTTEPLVRPADMDIRVNYTILVPENTNIEIDGANGNIYIAKGCGDLQIHGNNADMDIYAPNGDVNVRSINGRIRVFESNGDVQVTTVNGSIYAHLLGGALYADTTNGTIIGYLLTTDVEACDLTSVNGGITLVAPEAVSASVHANTDRGSIHSDFPMLAQPVPIKTQREVQGVIGRGQTRLTMSSMNGNIAITRSST